MRTPFPVGRSLVLGLLLCAAIPAMAQTPVDKPDIPEKFTRPTTGFDYVKRVVMIPMRDGVKLYTVIVVPKGAKNAPIILTRTPYNAAGRADARRSRRACWRRCRRATRCSSPTATSASSRTCAASTAPRATT